MGTPDLAAVTLESLMQDGREVSLVVTQPDRPKGRGKSIAKSAVKECAEKWNLPVFQPEKIRTPEAVERLREENADLIVVAAFGQILPEEILNMPRYGCVNVHASLLPAYRGAAPIQWAVINGEEKSGITIMQMDKGLDTGDILLQEETPIAEKETGESLYDRLAQMGGQLILRAIDRIEEGSLTPVKQDADKSSYASMLDRKMGEIDWSKSAVEIERLVRGLNSWPSAYTYLNEKMLKVWMSDVVKEEAAEVLKGGIETSAPGTVIASDKKHIYVQTGEGILSLDEVQPAGKKRMPVQAFLLGYKIEPGTKLG